MWRWGTGMDGEISPARAVFPDNNFVGRERERAELSAALADAAASRGRLFLISGEPGIGKTRLADDLHDADQPSLLMLKFVARELHDARIVVLATYRESEVRRSPALSQLIGDLLRDAQHLQLSGLSKTDVARFIELRSERSAEPEL